MDIIAIGFKHKWKVILFTLAGLGAAAAFYFTNPPMYESEAKLLVRYVVETSAVDSLGGPNGGAPKGPSDSILNSEVEIFNSWDLFEQVADQIGPNRLCPELKDPTTIDGARTIASGLAVSTLPSTNVILVSFKSPSAELAPQVLQALLEAYFSKHLDIHRSKAAFDLVSQQTDIIRGELEKTQEDIKKKKAEANIISVQDTSNNLNVELAETEREIDSQRTTLAEQVALVSALDRAAGGGGDGQARPAASAAAPAAKGKPAAGAIPVASGSGTVGGPVVVTDGRAGPDEVEKYEACVDEILSLQKQQFELLSIYNDQSTPVQLNKARIADLQTERRQLEKEHPDLTEAATAAAPASGHGYDLTAEKARLLSMEAGMKALEGRLTDIQQRARDFAKVAPDIQQLEQTEQLEQANYTTSQSKLQNATVDEALDPSKIPNISTVQKPSPSMVVAGKRQKVLLGLAFGGFGVGLGLALLIELVLDQTIKRPVELEHRLGVPISLSIPYISEKENRKLPALGNGENEEETAVVKNGHAKVAPWEVTHFVRQYAETIRDRLGLYFETNNMTHRPKLLAITGSTGGSGTSTLAAGIASALSETGEGKVLLVDMNQGRTEAHPFFKGRPACSLTTAISNDGELTSAGDNLYLATTTSNGKGAGSFGLKRLRELIPNIKESDFDYVLFDMPPLSQTSPTAAMASYMDRVIFVVEAEKGQREVVKRDYDELVSRKKDVLVIMNKVHSYGPKWIDRGA
jgi:uncharacterized protein involved in exopolysaccharide biosynthesis/Mrp family chromosome partitioning ATPase